MSTFKPFPEVSLLMTDDCSAARIVDGRGNVLIMDTNCDTAILERFVECWNACRKLYAPAAHITATDEYVARLDRIRLGRLGRLVGIVDGHQSSFPGITPTPEREDAA